jgi:hypothetical protein
MALFGSAWPATLFLIHSVASVKFTFRLSITPWIAPRNFTLQEKQWPSSSVKLKAVLFD